MAILVYSTNQAKMQNLIIQLQFILINNITSTLLYINKNLILQLSITKNA